jgi:hypothetical protein
MLSSLNVPHLTNTKARFHLRVLDAFMRVRGLFAVLGLATLRDGVCHLMQVA